MGELLEALHRLQTVELQLAQLRRGQESKSRRIDAQARQLKKLDDRLESYRRTILEYQKRIDSLNLDVKAREESIAKHRDALTKAKTNKEYASILAALNTEKADNAKVETAALELMEQIKSVQDEAAGVQAERDQVLKRHQAAEAELQKYEQGIEDKQTGLMAERERISEDIPPATLDTFNRVAEHHDGEAMVPVEQIHPKRQEYTCSGCNMKVTLEVINALQMGTEVQFCSVCGRILYLEQAVQRS